MEDVQDEIKNENKQNSDRSKKLIDEFEIFKNDFVEKTSKLERELGKVNVNFSENSVNVKGLFNSSD